METLFDIKNIQSMSADEMVAFIDFVGRAKLNNIIEEFAKDKELSRSKVFKDINASSKSKDGRIVKFFDTFLRRGKETTKGYEFVLTSFEKKFAKTLKSKADIDISMQKDLLLVEIEKTEALSPYQKAVIRKAFGASIPDEAMKFAKKQTHEATEKIKAEIAVEKKNENITATNTDKLDDLRQKNQKLNSSNQKLNNQVTDLEKRLDEAQAENAKLTKRIDGLTEEIAQMKDRLFSVLESIPQTIDNEGIETLIAGIREALAKHDMEALKSRAIGLYILAHMNGEAR